MNWLANFAYTRTRWAWSVVGGIAILVSLLVLVADLRAREQQQLTLLQTEAKRSALEIQSTTRNGNIMGAITLLGLIDGDIKQEATNGLLSQDAHIDATLSTLGNASDADAVFVVGQDGIVKTAWDRAGKLFSGLDVSMRPYFQIAVRGQSSVYAAVSKSTGERVVYFAAPIFAERARATTGVGAVVARVNLEVINSMLRNRFDVALLLSPQGVVFAGNQEAWLGAVEGTITPERLKAIRDLKQFGEHFDKAEPRSLPLPSSAGFETLDAKRFAVSTALVHWNDPTGDWKLAVMEDMGRSVPMFDSLWKGLLAGVVVVLLGWLWLHLLQGHHAQDATNAQLRVFADQQQQMAEFRKKLGNAAVQLQRCETLDQLATVFFVQARLLLDAPQGVMYVAAVDAPDVLRLAGCSACAQPPADVLVAGDGLLGQCALDHQTRVFATPEDGPWMLRSGLGGTAPLALIMGPVMIRDTLIGVVELALLKVPDQAAQDHFAELLAALANSLEILRRNLLLQHMAEQHSQPPEMNP
jgi:C4-dicarboxylate-specific signal transduction histidine kinase